jgi:V/A-type H+-transporting ATPase subunit E
MGYQELIESLRKRSLEDLKALEEEARREIESYRERLFSEFEEKRKESIRKAEERVLKEVSSLLFKAKREAQTLRTIAMKELSERLYKVARDSLNELRSVGYEETFERLVMEIPSFKWSRVYVNPSDEEIARRYFPSALILKDQGISGGLRVESEDGINIDNTFEKRLERLWPEILPEILKEVLSKNKD